MISLSCKLLEARHVLDDKVIDPSDRVIERIDKVIAHNLSVRGKVAKDWLNNSGLFLLNNFVKIVCS